MSNKNDSLDRIFIFDFDSTLVSLESAIALADIALGEAKDKKEKMQEIKKLTEQGMRGEISLVESISRRFSMLHLTKEHVVRLAKDIHQHLSPSLLPHLHFFKEYKDQIYVFSGGVTEVILPCTRYLGIADDHVFANRFVYDFNDRVIGFDERCPMLADDGKQRALESLSFKGLAVMVGDGANDLAINAAAQPTRFYAYCEHVQREPVMKAADGVLYSFDDFLNAENIALQHKPLTKKVLLLEKVHPNAIRTFKEKGYDVKTYDKALNEAELIDALKEIHLLGIRSKTNVTDKVIAAAPHLEAIGAFCIGTNQIDLETCKSKGIAVFNAPYSNTRSVVELTLAEMILLMRNVIDKDRQMHEGHWGKSAEGAFEVRGKVLGIIGYGNIGSQLSILAENLGLHVIFYDTDDKLPLGLAKKCDSIEALLRKADIVSIHVDGRAENENFMNREKIQLMKPGAIFLNLSRGHVVDQDALAEALKSKQIRGAAVDVYPYEPSSGAEKFTSPLQHLPNVLLTPHVGGSTAEAQANIGDYVTERLLSYLMDGTTLACVNLPNIALPAKQHTHRVVHLHRNVPGILAKINQVFAIHKINIEAQHLKTSSDVGFVISDIAETYHEDLIVELKAIEDTLLVRVVY